ncbi:MAG: hypothetical protein EB830_00680 [Nitrosopumilus sp. H13]|nr:MAG: hypothetical protein EB830_00680 [Nitrosopumilus sp. H13]
MNHGVMVIMAVFLVPLSVAYGETISAQDSDSAITIQVDGDRLVTYSVSLADGSEMGPVDPKFQARSFGFLIIDKAGGFFAAVKNTDAGYEIRARIGLGAETLVKEYTVYQKMEKDDKTADADEKNPADNKEPPAKKNTDEKKPADDAPKPDKKPKNPVQRNLLDATVLDPDKDKDAGAKPANTAEEEAKRIRDEALKKLEEQNKSPIKSKKSEPSAVRSYEEYKKQVDNSTEPAPPANIGSFEFFAHVPHVKLNSNLEHEVLVTDDAANIPSGKYDVSVGKGIPGIVITSVLKDVRGGILDKQNGVTDKNGVWEAKPYKIPSQKEKKKFVIDLTATHKEGKKTLKIQKIFRTVSDTDGIYEKRPVAAATFTATKINTDITESIKAAIKKYQNLDTKLAKIDYDGTDFIDNTSKFKPVKLTHASLMDLLRNSGHVKVNGGDLSWDFCRSSNVTLNAGSSHDPDDDELVYKWGFEGPSRYAGSVNAMFNSTDPVSKAVIDLRSDTPKSFSFGLVVSDLEFDSEEDFVKVDIDSDTNSKIVLCNLP